jgi:hypothetical protein
MVDALVHAVWGIIWVSVCDPVDVYCELKMQATFHLYPSPNGDSICIDPDDENWNECYLNNLPGELKRLAEAKCEPPPDLLPESYLFFEGSVIKYDYINERWHN